VKAVGKEKRLGVKKYYGNKGECGRYEGGWGVGIIGSMKRVGYREN
jgi:hypothetical protein